VLTAPVRNSLPLMERHSSLAAIKRTIRAWWPRGAVPMERANEMSEMRSKLEGMILNLGRAGVVDTHENHIPVTADH